MYNFSMGPLLLFLTVLLFVFWTFGFVIRKLLRVERRKWFSPHYVNKTHKKVDWALRMFFLALILFGAYYTISNNTYGVYWYIEPWFIAFISIFTSESLRAFMEWKYVENKKESIVTIAELLFMLSVTVLVIITDFFGLI